MTHVYDIEIGEDSSPSVCNCCGRESCIGHGFICKDGIAYAIYYAGWSSEHMDKRITFALAIGDWDDGSTCSDRTCFGFEALEDRDRILFRVVDPEESPWPITDLMGEMISRKEGLSHRLLPEVFVLAEEIARNHPAIRDYLGISAI